MLHILFSMEDLIQEMEDYPYAHTKDILDCLGYLVKNAPGMYESQEEIYKDPFMIDNIEEEVRSRKGNKRYPFEDPWAREEEEFDFGNFAKLR